MSIVIPRGEWLGLSFEDLCLGLAGAIFVCVLARLFGDSLAMTGLPLSGNDRTELPPEKPLSNSGQSEPEDTAPTPTS